MGYAGFEITDNNRVPPQLQYCFQLDCQTLSLDNNACDQPQHKTLWHTCLAYWESMFLPLYGPLLHSYFHPRLKYLKGQQCQLTSKWSDPIKNSRSKEDHHLLLLHHMILVTKSWCNCEFPEPTMRRGITKSLMAHKNTLSQILLYIIEPQ